MKYIPYYLFISALTVPALSAFAGGYQLYEQANPAIGTANVGQAAYANDASTAYFNPAGMTQLTHPQIMLGTQVLLGNIRFKPNANTSFSGTNGGQAATLEPGAGLYSVTSWSSKLKLGVSITAPYAGMLAYTDGWIGRYFVQDTTFMSLNLNPAMAYSVNEFFAIGLGASVEYALLNQTSALYNRDTPQDDGQINIKSDNFAAGFNLGVLFTPNKTTRLGLAYRSKITHNLKGKTTFLRTTIIPTVTAQMIEPQNIIFSTYHDASPKIALVGELGWGNWQQLKNTFVQISNNSLLIPLDWHDTYHLGAGLQYQLRPQLKVQSGIAYDSSPTSSSKRLPNLPVDKQIRIGTGSIYTTKTDTKVGLQIEYVDFGTAAINRPTAVGTLAGKYGNNYAIVIATNVNFAI